MKLYIQTVYIPRENIYFIEEWLAHHKKLGVDEFYMYDNSGSYYKDFVGNFMIDGRNKQGVNIKEETSHLSDDDIRLIEDLIFEKYNAKRIEWKPRDFNGNITYNQIGAIISFQNMIEDGYCAFIDIDEFIILKKHNSIKDYIKETIGDKDGIKILQKKYLNRWYQPKNVKGIDVTFPIDTERWAPKIIADLSKIKPSPNSNIHTFLPNVVLDKENCWFNHYNHESNGHTWLMHNYLHLDPDWKPFPFAELEKLLNS